jgi:excisionase family DNA binding protein
MPENWPQRTLPLREWKEVQEMLSRASSMKSEVLAQFEPLLSDTKVSKLLGLHPKTVARMARRGELPAIRIGRYWRFRASELDAWLETIASGRKKPCSIVLESERQPACVGEGE